MKRGKFILALCAALVLALALAFTLAGCKEREEKLVDGYYTVELSAYSHGWKEFVTICVSDGKIVTVEYNARNPSGFIKSWDLAYMRNMNRVAGTYPNRYTRTYAASFLKIQSEEGIDIVSGASSSGGNFRKMAALLLQKAKEGDFALGIVQVEE